jgi:transposase
MNESTLTTKRASIQEQGLLHIGLDVHKETIAVGLAMGREEANYWKTIAHDLHAVEKLVAELRKMGKELKVCYEAGPTGFVLARRFKAWGIDCVVVAPSLIPKGSGDKVKTDKRDAARLARLLRAGELVAVNIPDEKDEAIRDLCRARTDAVEDLRRLRQQLKAFLLRNGYRYTGKSSWTEAHLRYLRELVMNHPAQKLVMEESLQSIEAALGRVDRLEKHLEGVVAEWRMKPVVESLQCLKGIAFLSATVLVSELGDLTRFQHPRQLMSYLGLVSSESSSGGKRRQGSITKCGNRHARLFLIEAAHHYRTPPKISKELSRRQEGKNKRVKEMAWEAQNRLHRRTWKLMARGVITPKVVVAVARELVGFVWAICLETQKPGSVPRRLPRVDKSPKESTHQVIYQLKQTAGAV